MAKRYFTTVVLLLMMLFASSALAQTGTGNEHDQTNDCGAGQGGSSCPGAFGALVQQALDQGFVVNLIDAGNPSDALESSDVSGSIPSVPVPGLAGVTFDSSFADSVHAMGIENTAQSFGWTTSHQTSNYGLEIFGVKSWSGEVGYIGTAAQAAAGREAVMRQNIDEVMPMVLMAAGGGDMTSDIRYRVQVWREIPHDRWGTRGGANGNHWLKELLDWAYDKGPRAEAAIRAMTQWHEEGISLEQAILREEQLVKAFNRLAEQGSYFERYKLDMHTQFYIKYGLYWNLR
jgi:hypothetical protein